MLFLFFFAKFTCCFMEEKQEKGIIMRVKLYVKENDFNYDELLNYAKENNMVIVEAYRMGVIAKLMRGFNVLDVIYYVDLQKPVEINVFGKKVKSVW